MLSAIRPFVVNLGVNLEVVSQRFYPNMYSKYYELTVRLKSHMNTDDSSSLDGRNDAVIFIPKFITHTLVWYHQAS